MNAKQPSPLYDFAPWAELVPEGGVPLYGFRVVVYVDAESGQVCDEYGVTGPATLRDFLGTVEHLKVRVIEDQHPLGGG